MEFFGNAFKKARQESAMYAQDGVKINDALWYHISKTHTGEIGIHLFRLNVGKTFKEKKEAFDLYREGLSELANRIESDPELSGISAVSGWSNVVYEHPNLLKKLGFEVTEVDADKKEALAIMSREQFLKRPWNTDISA